MCWRGLLGGFLQTSYGLAKESLSTESQWKIQDYLVVWFKAEHETYAEDLSLS